MPQPEASAKNQGRLVDPEQASGGGAQLGLGHVQSSDPQQAARLRCGRLKVEDVARMTVDRALVRERKTGRPFDRN
jgi:hypothetical protein